MKAFFQRLRKRNNPFEVLIIALVFFLLGVGMLSQRGPLVMIWSAVQWVGGGLPEYREVVPEHSAKVYTAVLFAIAFLLCAFYFYLRSEIKKDNAIPNRRT